MIGAKTRFQSCPEHVELSRKAGRRSGEVRREKAALREALEIALDQPTPTGDCTTREAICAALIKAAMNGSVKAFEVIRDTIGEKPIEHVMVSEVDPSIVDEVEKMVVG